MCSLNHSFSSHLPSTLYDPQIAALEARVRQSEDSNKKLRQQLQQRLQDHDDTVQARIRDAKVWGT